MTVGARPRRTTGDAWLPGHRRATPVRPRPSAHDRAPRPSAHDRAPRPSAHDRAARPSPSGRGRRERLGVVVLDGGSLPAPRPVGLVDVGVHQHPAGVGDCWSCPSPRRTRGQATYSFISAVWTRSSVRWTSPHSRQPVRRSAGRRAATSWLNSASRTDLRIRPPLVVARTVQNGGRARLSQFPPVRRAGPPRAWRAGRPWSRRGRPAPRRSPRPRTSRSSRAPSAARRGCRRR